MLMKGKGLLKLRPQFTFANQIKPYNTVYLDNQATTPLDFRVCDAMLPYLTDSFGNPHSKSHQYGWKAEDAVEEARGHIADLINCDAKDIIYTSGSTESNNLSL